MEIIKKYKNILIGVGVLALVFAGYLYFRSDNSASEILTATEPPPEAELAGQEILSVLNELHGLHIDGSVFQNPVFKSLIDYTVATTAEPLGRPDPFKPLPIETSANSQK